MQPSTAPTQALGRNPMLREICDVPNVRLGSWLCENAKTLNRDRRSYSSKTVLVAQRASGFNLEIELKNIILRRVSIFEFLHSQGHIGTSDWAGSKQPLKCLMVWVSPRCQRWPDRTRQEFNPARGFLLSLDPCRLRSVRPYSIV